MQQKEIRRQWAWGKVRGTVADWKRQQKEMGQLAEAVEKSGRWCRCSRGS